VKNTSDIWRLVEDKRERFFALSDQVWDTPELNFGEWQSSAAHLAVLQAEGFRVSAGIAGMPTALMGEAGAGGPVIAILGEYDALPGLSQQAGIARHEKRADSDNGHGCGHNLLGAGSLLAATAVKDYLALHGLPGRVRYYGCPAEEGGSSKGFMVRAGVFDDVGLYDCLYWLHTHAADGIIHVEAPAKENFTLGQFFDIWNQPLSSTQLGPDRGPVVVFENGKRLDGDPRATPLSPHATIQLDVGSPPVPFQPFTFKVTGGCGQGTNSCKTSKS